MNLGSLLNQGCFKNTVFFVEKHCVSVCFLNPGFNSTGVLYDGGVGGCLGILK